MLSSTEARMWVGEGERLTVGRPARSFERSKHEMIRPRLRH